MSKTSSKTRNQKHDIIEEIHNYSVLLETREIFLHGETDSDNGDSGVEFRMSNKFLKNIKLLEELGSDPIIIHQHSIGGNWFDGMLIYDSIYNSMCHVVVVMHGSAFSMGSIIPQAADTRIIMPNCAFMIHDGYTGIDSSLTYKQSKSWSDMESKIRDKMLDIYCSVCKNGHIFQKEQADEKKIRTTLVEKMSQKEDWWLFSRDVVNYGFADVVFGQEGYENIEQIREMVVNE